MIKEKNNITGGQNINEMSENDQSEYFNYGFNLNMWKIKMNKFRSYIKSLIDKNENEKDNDQNKENDKEKNLETDKCYKYFKENLVKSNNLSSINEEEYLRKLPLEFGGLGKKLDNPDKLNLFAYNCINFSDKVNVPPVIYNTKYNRHVIELPNTNKNEKLTEDNKKHYIELTKGPDMLEKKIENKDNEVILINSNNIKNLSNLKNSLNITSKKERSDDEKNINFKSDYFFKGKSNTDLSAAKTSSVSSISSRNSNINSKVNFDKKNDFKRKTSSSNCILIKFNFR